MEKLNIEKVLGGILQEELDKIWDEMPIGYNKVNDGYHMGKGLVVNKETWDKYVEALKTNIELNAYEFMVQLIKDDCSKNMNSISEKGAWDDYSVIAKLVEAADILLHKLDYDGDGWEQIQICYERGVEILRNMKQDKL